MNTNPNLDLRRFAPRPIRAAAVLAILCLVSPGVARASERWATLEAIHQLENPSDSPRPGALGELGAYQFREETWKMHTLAPFSRALDRRSSDAVAVKHYEWIKGQLEKRGLEASPFRIALAWNGGLRAAVREHPPSVAIEYASRAANLAASYERSEDLSGN